MMLKVLLSVLSGFILLFAAGDLTESSADKVSGNGMDIKEGLWSFTTVITMTGFPGIPPRTIQFDDCLTSRHLVPLKSVKNCAMSTPRIIGRTLSYQMHCPSGNATGTFTYGKKELTGLIVFALTTPANARIDEHITGRYQAPCKQS